MDIIRQTTLATIILRNSDTSILQCSPFAKADGCWCKFYFGQIDCLTVSTGNVTSPLNTTSDVDFIVNVAVKSPSHPFYNQGDINLAFTVNGQEYAILNLTKGKTYKFKNMASNSHR
jgi:hypothetical protein